MGGPIVFTQDEPARSLEELLEFLQADHPRRYMFRGQVADYNVLLPSDFRRFDLGPGVLPHVRAIDETAYARQTGDLSSHRRFGGQFFRDLNLVMLNVPLGNIVSQQYGLSSATLDFTLSVEVAGFFASRDWPHYRTAARMDGLGVIYRLRRPSVEISNELMVRLHQRVGAPLAGEDVWLWFDEFIPSWQHDGAEEVFASRGLTPTQKSSRLRTPAIALTCDYLLANLQQQLASERTLAQEYLLGKLGITESEFDEFGRRIVKLATEAFESRIHAQHACLMLAPSWHQALMANPYFAMQTDNHRVRLADPALAVGQRRLGIEDLVSFDQLESFYFRHAPDYRPRLTPEQLWPNALDPLFDFYRWLFDLAKARGTFDHHLTFDDRDTGLFDRGYY